MEIIMDPERAILVLVPTLIGLYFVGRIGFIFIQALRARDPYEFHQKDFAGKMLTSAVCSSCLLVPMLALRLDEGIMLWTVFGLSIAFFCMYAWQASQRHKKRPCPECGMLMRKIEDAIEERKFLTVKQAWEEFMHVKDYDVWICPKGHIRKDAYKV